MLVQQEGLQDRAMQLLESFAASLGVATEHVYAVLVRQMQLEAIVYLVLTVLMVVALAVALRRFVPAFKVAINCSYADEDKLYPPAFVWGAISLVLLIGVAIMAVDVMPVSILKLQNPEYYAIKELLNAFSGLR